MKKILIGLAGLVGGVVIITAFNHTRAYLAASAIYKDYELCDRGYKLLGKRDRFIEGLIELKEDKNEEKNASMIRVMDEVEASCAKYKKYLDEWDDIKISPSTELVLALVSRYEPERLKQK